MALKGRRTVLETQITKKCTNIAERGKIVIDAGSAGFVTLGGAVASGDYAAGLLLDDVENRDLTMYPSNQHKNLAQVSGQVSLARKGKFLTNAIPSGITIAQYEPAFLADSGLISNVAAGVGELTIPVGTWMIAKDADGYAEISLHLD